MYLPDLSRLVTYGMECTNNEKYHFCEVEMKIVNSSDIM